MPVEAAGWAEAELRRRYGEPTTDTDKVAGFTLQDSRQLALQRDVRGTQLWLEDDPTRDGAPTQQICRYQASEGRHSNLPLRLRHQPPGGAAPRPVCLVTIADAPTLQAVLDWYDNGKGAGVDRIRLEQYRQLFLARYPDFVDFTQNDGGYFTDERAHKNKLIEHAASALAAGMDELALGARLLDLLTGRGGVPSGLLGWRTEGRLVALRAAHPGLLEQAAGRLARAEDVDKAVADFVTSTWPLLIEGQTSKPYSESRNLPTMLAALVHADSAYGINTDPVQRTAEALLGRKLLGWNPMTADEYATVLGMADEIRAVMANDWRWKPRDLWDVQGFIWAVNLVEQPQPNLPSVIASATKETPLARNLIFYGPPGTGKTFATAAEAVRLCGKPVPENRTDLMNAYNALTEVGQVAFVTFHQSYAYEDFVEGLRPTTDSDEGEGHTGFRLTPRRGIFREISALAEQARKSSGRSRSFDVGTRQIFKMSLGRAGAEDHIFDAAKEGNYVALGWGGDIDWSDPRYNGDAGYRAIYDAWNEREPGTPGNSGHISQLWRFRSSMREGDLVIVPWGNTHFRAVGEIIGPYQYDPGDAHEYHHWRPVRWLLTPDEPLAADTIYAKPFTMRSCYLLRNDYLKREALARLMPGDEVDTSVPPDQFVLIIDEINRANISKVFGELITLLEQDKRLGAQNEIKVKLPYSGDLFGMPPNLHIIGTMNTADRSIALLDTALRRRFSFVELMPNPSLLGSVDGINLTTLLTKINDAIEYLFDREHQIGHAYFIDCTSRADIDAAMRQKAIPLLAEYFHEDWSRIAAVLGDLDEAEGDYEGGFLDRRQLSAPAALANASETLPRYRWAIRSVFNYSKLQ